MITSTTIAKKSHSLFSADNKQKQHFPLANLYQHDREYILTIAAPGFQRNQFDIMVNKDVLSIGTTNKEKVKQAKDSQCEYDYSSWKRQFVLPANADATMMASTYINGELIIRIPKYSSRVLHEDVLRVVVY